MVTPKNKGKPKKDKDKEKEEGYQKPISQMSQKEKLEEAQIVELKDGRKAPMILREPTVRKNKRTHWMELQKPENAGFKDGELISTMEVVNWMSAVPTTNEELIERIDTYFYA